ncbi:hypothetical protein [Paraburkholderia strydomiana]|uniref:hypothetical protein n=1 Tax=Paraburkholderia strydomiana TaxID=1245417 RepID=UPI00286C5C95|nr:hypothetical protein [Paraburkholderia strydomiana]
MSETLDLPAAPALYSRILMNSTRLPQPVLLSRRIDTRNTRRFHKLQGQCEQALGLKALLGKGRRVFARREDR